MESVLACFEEMKKTLKDEVQAPVAHLYAQHMSIFQTYSILSQVASQYNSGAIVQKALEIFKILIYCEEVEFLRENTFSDALLDLIGSFSITGSLLVSVNVEERIVEALFAIASKLPLQPNLNCQPIPWKEDILDVPLFRAPVQTSRRYATSADTALSYEKYHEWIKRLGEETGFVQVFTTYCLRRATGNAINGES